MKIVCDVADNNVVKNTKFNTFERKVYRVEKKIPHTVTLIHINQYNTEKTKLDKKIRDVETKADTSDLVLS